MGEQLGLSTPGPLSGRRAWAERHISWLFLACAAGLAPWVVFLFIIQVSRAEAHQVRPLSTGLLLGMIAGILLTAWTYHRGSPLAVVTASFSAAAAFIAAAVTGALLICDAWINIVPAQGAAFWEVIAMAFVELPLAALSFWVATRHLARPAGWLSHRAGGRLPVLLAQRPLEDFASAGQRHVAAIVSGR
jgi:FtsH-binding integral membrane protein